jgi:hypothetical protein
VNGAHLESQVARPVRWVANPIFHPARELVEQCAARNVFRGIVDDLQNGGRHEIDEQF